MALPSMSWWECSSPVGPLLLAAEGKAITGLHFRAGHGDAAPPVGALKARAPFESLIAQLEEYFAGERLAFKLELAPRGTTFQREVWRAISEIAYADTCSYAELAARIGHGKALRAVGQACGANPLPIIVPCHRVLASHRALGGFTGGVAIKQKLLALEALSKPFALTAAGS
jgi:methylated-DNA-[protein]-cysteine S-methyltransferase